MPECSGTERGSYLFGMPGRNLSGRQILCGIRCDTLEKIVSALGYEIALVKIIEK